MFLPSFRHLIEIEALKIQNQSDNDEIANEKKRISDIEERRKKTFAHIDSLNVELKELMLDELQKNSESHQQKITRMKSQMDMVVNEKEANALASQITLLTSELASFEENYFTKLERSEEIAEEKKSLNEFLEGSLKTIAEIEVDVKAASEKINQRIEGRNQRITSLIDQCDPKLKTFYGELEKKFSPKRPVAYLIDKKCSSCHMMVDSMFKSSVEEGRSYETCPNCGRLLIPETAKIYQF